MRLDKSERETSITTTEADETIRIYTHNRKLKYRLSAFSESYPESCRRISKADEDGVTYEIDKACFHIRLDMPESEERRKQRREAALRQGLGKYERKPP